MAQTDEHDRTQGHPAEDYRTVLRVQLTDPARLAAVRRRQDDVAWRGRARMIAELASQMLSTELAEVNLVTDVQMHTVGSAAGAERVLDVEISFCQHVVGTSAAVVVYESTEHALVQSSPGAQRLHCYLGIPLVVDGEVVGALCVAGADPREWTATEIALLTELAETLASSGRTGCPGA